MQHPLTSPSVAFDGITLEIIDHAGRRWITAEQLGLCLGYSKEKARTDVTNLYARHKDEFTERDTIAIKLMANSPGNPMTRIFSDTGCNNVGFFASTPNAKRFRAFAKEALAAERRETPDPAVSSAHHTALIDELFSARPKWAKLVRYAALGLNNHEMGRLLDCNESTVRGWKARLAACGLVAAPLATHPQLALCLLDDTGGAA